MYRETEGSGGPGQMEEKRPRLYPPLVLSPLLEKLGSAFQCGQSGGRSAASLSTEVVKTSQVANGPGLTLFPFFFFF